MAADVPALREKIAFAQDKPYATIQGVSWRVLFLLAAGAQIVRGRPLGSWTSTLYRWTPIDSWLPGKFAELETDHRGGAARAPLAGRVRAGTMADLKWWTGWTVGLLKRALSQLDTVEVQLDGSEVGLVLAGDEEPVAAEPWVALLPALDPAPIGWKSRAWYLGEDRERLFDRSGNIGPTVWWEGRIVGGWAQGEGSGEIVVGLLEDLGADAAAAIEPRRRGCVRGSESGG